jgi:protein-tyrosine kinase
MERIKRALELARQARKVEPSRELPSAVASPAAQPTATKDFSVRSVSVSPAALERNRTISGKRGDMLTDLYKLLRTQVVQRMQENKWRVLAVTGPREGIGKTLTAANLAISIAGSVNQSVVLLDLDLRRPSIHTMFGYQPLSGIADYLLKTAPLDDVAFCPAVERLTVVPGKNAVEQSSEMLSAPEMRQFFDQLLQADKSRLLVCDLPPVLVGDDVLAFSPFVDAFLLVVEEAKTTREDLMRTLELLGKTKVLGTVLNKSQDGLKSDYYSTYTRAS